MGEARQHQTAATSTAAGPEDLSAAFRAARALLDDAERQAAEIVADAERQARSLEREAELLVARARRLLGVAEHKAAHLVAEARRSGPEVIDLTDAAPPGRVATAARRRRRASGVDQLLASAVAQALDEALAAADRGVARR